MRNRLGLSEMGKADYLLIRPRNNVFLCIFCLYVSIKLFDKISHLLSYKYKETLIY